MMVIRSAGVLLLLSAVAVLAGCGSSGGSGGGSLEGTTWVLSSYVDAGGKSVAVPSGAIADARFDAGRVGGSSGVNSYSGPYQLSGAKLTIGPLISTQMAGPPPLMALEQAYLAALQKVASYTADDATLTLFDTAGKQLLVFAKGATPSLTGKTWDMLFTNNGKGAAVSAVAGSKVTAVFSEDGKLSGSGGCNDYSATYTTSGDGITVTGLLSTKKACEYQEQEDAYFAALQTAARYELRGDTLELRTKDGALAVSYKAAQ